MRWGDLPARPRRVLIVALHLVAVAVVGVADYVSGPQYELRTFYLIPVMSATWLGGRAFGLGVAALATVSLFFANDYLGRALAYGIDVPLWNTITRFVLYSVVVLLTAQLRRQDRELRSRRDELLREAELREGSIALFVHELRHSAASMALASASLESSPRLADDERSFVGRLRQQAGDLERVASGLLTIGRLESGSLALDLVPVDLDRLACDAAAASNAPDRIEVRHAARPVAVRADPDHLRRALDNYIRNALAYSAPPARVTVDVVEREGAAGLVVSDAGIGFDPRETSKLFRKYGRLSGPSERRDGAGLGLYLTRLIVEAHGGTVDARSEGRGTGARFALYLPLAREV
ncbi:MAG: sensor histidine kinase [Chloroflexota bacterium]|nr:sensor histidine kinase [Chloroflexota bacterium]MDE3192438.1 sensor histidine kinase [Chloroflexota bacterium]